MIPIEGEPTPEDYGLPPYTEGEDLRLWLRKSLRIYADSYAGVLLVENQRLRGVLEFIKVADATCRSMGVPMPLSVIAVIDQVLKEPEDILARYRNPNITNPPTQGKST